MKLASYYIPEEQRNSFGLVGKTGIVDLVKQLKSKYADLKSFLTAGTVAELRGFVDAASDYSINEIRYLPVIPTPEKIVGVAMNYFEKNQPPKPFDKTPALFVRFPDSQTGHESVLLKPTVSSEFDFEGELAVIIGKPVRRVPEADAMQYVAGYSCYMDGSVRDWQHTLFTAGKNWPCTGGFGPWMVTADEIEDPHDLLIQTRLNGVLVQDDKTSSMMRSIHALISFVSQFTSLAPGDVIISGTPDGIGKKRTPPLYLCEGDVIEVQIDRIGTLRNTVVNDN